MLTDLDLLSGTIPNQIAVLGDNGRYVYVNSAFEHRYGISRAKAVGMTVEEVVEADLWRKYALPIQKALQGEGGCIEHTFPHRTEGRAWRTSFVPRPEGGCMIVSDDPGESAKSNRVQRTEERLQAFVDFAPIGMIFSHLDGRVLEANRAFLELIEYTRDDLVNGHVHWDKLTPAEYLHLDYEAIAEAKESGYSRTYEKEYVTKSGKRVHILVGFILVGPTRDEAVAFVVDITAVKNAEDEVRRLNAELEERVQHRTMEFEAANKELEAFCYSVSHDLRAPLRSIDGFAFALFQDYESQLDEDGVDFINRIRGSVKRMDELISALLTLSRLTRVELELENVDVSEMAEGVASEIRHQYPDRKIEFTIQPGLVLRADRKMLRVVIDNLFQNSVKFTAKRAIASITLGQTEPSGGMFVRDNGVGFNMEESSKLYQPFERLHSPREFTGSGIGLATVQRIVRKHGGTIWAEAEVEKGATFFFTM